MTANNATTGDPLIVGQFDRARTNWLLTGQVEDGESIREVSVHPLPFQVGRRKELGLSLPCRTVSGLHAEFVAHGEGGLAVRDLNSTNGTFVNGARMRGVVELKEGDLVQFAAIVFRVGSFDGLRASGTLDSDVSDRAVALVQFDRLLEQRAIVPFFQPIVDTTSLRVLGFEMLARSRLYGLTNPKMMFAAAAQLNLEVELSRMMRVEGMRAAKTLDGRPNLFLNTHPAEMRETGLFDSVAAVRAASPDQPITLEIHESSVSSAAMMRELRAKLRDLDVKIAYDDFGEGQARLAELVEVRPDYLKFDINLVKDIHLSSVERQKLLRNLVRMASDLGIVPLAEGVESKGESDFCRDIGFKLGQGYYYGRPAPICNKRTKATSAESRKSTGPRLSK